MLTLPVFSLIDHPLGERARVVCPLISWRAKARVRTNSATKGTYTHALWESGAFFVIPLDVGTYHAHQ